MKSVGRETFPAVLIVCAWLAIALCNSPDVAAASSLQYRDAIAPSRSIRAIVGFPPGNATDMLARLVGGRLGERLGHQVVVDNRAGANGIIAAHITATSTPDGHTLLFMSSSHAMNAAVNPLPFDPVKSFTPVARLGTGPLVLVANPSFPVSTVRGLIDYAMARPNAVTYASVGAGGINHFAGALFARMTGIQLLHVPYKGGVPALTDVIGGHVHVMFGTLPLALRQIQVGKVSALGVTSTRRARLLPEVPTIAESGVPGYEFNNWWGVLAPAGVPAAIVAKLSDDLAGIMVERESGRRLEAEGIVAAPLPAAAFTRLLVSEIDKWRRVAREAGIRAE